MELKSQDSKMIQGLSVLAMLCLHLFCKDYQELFEPLVLLEGVPLSFYLAQLSDFCVMGFAFCSGYGHMVQSKKANYYLKRVRGLITLLVNYWVVLVAFCLISFLCGNGTNMPGSVKEFILHFLTLRNDYNGAWWYLNTYILLVLLSPLILKIVDRYNVYIVLLLTFGIYCLAFYVRFYAGSVGWLLERFGLFGMTIFEYILGAISFKYKFFSKVYEYYMKVNKKYRCILCVLLFLAMIYGRTKIVPNVFVAPVTGLILITMFHFWNKPNWIRRFFVFIGSHSTNIWLTHMFFYSTLFVRFVYFAKNPVLIFLLMLMITLVVSIFLKMLQRPIADKIVNRKIWRIYEN